MKHLKGFKIFENSNRNLLLGQIKYLKTILIRLVASPELYYKNLKAWESLYGKDGPKDAEYDKDFVIHLKNAGNRSTAQARYDEFICDVFRGYNLGYITYSQEDFSEKLGVDEQTSLYCFLVSRWDDLSSDEYEDLLYKRFRPLWEDVEL